jgi:hypothetical protein
MNQHNIQNVTTSICSVKMGAVLGRFKNKQQYGNRVKERIPAWTSSQISLSEMVKSEM